MTELLTTKQVKNLLQIDRTTVYRMLNDGRLTGIKVGSHWRFRRDEIDELLSIVRADKKSTPTPDEILPIHCIQSIQDVFAEIADVGAITTDRHGEPITNISHCAQFCSLILNTLSGKRACIQSWKRLAQAPEGEPEFVSCHAGLQYARGCIKIAEKPAALVVSGQFYLRTPDSREETERIHRLAEDHGIDFHDISEAASKISLLDERKQSQIAGWMSAVARTFSEIATERAEILERLRGISEMSKLERTA